MITSPGQDQAIPLKLKFVAPQDDHAKQDGELAAATRWLQCEDQGLAAHHVTILGEDLYSHPPFCEMVKAKNKHFILVCKPEQANIRT